MFRKALTIENRLKFDVRTEQRETIPATMTETEFENFYNEHSRPLWLYARRLAGSETVADDVAQESFLRFLGAAVREDANKRAYLYRIATNLVYDNFRRGKREIPQPTLADSEANFESAYEPFAPESDIGKVFDKLKPQERALLWLAYVEGYDHKEIAATLGLQSLSVRVLLFRARRRLAGLLDEKTLEV